MPSECAYAKAALQTVSGGTGGADGALIAEASRRTVAAGGRGGNHPANRSASVMVFAAGLLPGCVGAWASAESPAAVVTEASLVDSVGFATPIIEPACCAGSAVERETAGAGSGTAGGAASKALVASGVSGAARIGGLEIAVDRSGRGEAGWGGCCVQGRGDGAGGGNMGGGRGDAGGSAATGTGFSGGSGGGEADGRWEGEAVGTVWLGVAAVEPIFGKLTASDAGSLASEVRALAWSLGSSARAISPRTAALSALIERRVSTAIAAPRVLKWMPVASVECERRPPPMALRRTSGSGDAAAETTRGGKPAGDGGGSSGTRAPTACSMAVRNG